MQERQPLEGVRVVDLSRVLAGPYCTMMLGDLGAEVIKVESPEGDEARQWGPPFTGGESAYYLCVNRNKKGITINLKTEAGQGLLRELVQRSDVLVENFRVGTMERWGLGYEALRELNPALIYCAITGFGPTGPYKDQAGYDFIVQAMGGIMSITGEPEGPPMKVGVAIVDITAGLFATVGILGALHERHRSGLGQRIDVSLLEAQVAWLANVGSNYLVSGQRPRRYGNAHASIVPYETFKARDSYIAIGVGNDRQWQRFCQLLGREELAHDPRFATNPRRVENRDVLIPMLQEVIATRDGEEWLRLLREADIPCSPINTIDRVFQDPQVLHREMVVEVPHPTAGKVRLAGIPFKLSCTPARVSRHPPLLGEHTAEVLADILGYGADRIASLREQGVL
ncbi:MAG: CaiB/BaiF CoA-transferase family protein [Chloroflexota bacterium]